MSVTFLLTTLVVVVTPGTGALFTIAAGLGRGRRASLVAAIGCTLGIVPHMVAAIAGLAALLYASSVAFATLKYLGVAYLLFLAWRTLRDRTPLTVNEDSAAKSDMRVVGDAVLINLLNPKLTIFFFAFLPQFVDPGQPSTTADMVALSGVFMGLTLVVFAAYGLFAAAVRTHVISRPRVVTWMRRTFAASYAVLAGRLALSDR
ncbi:MAG TPA: LysE family translocator [Propionibacteriaceae bacterium]|nr:LysE family translocator [Propionibacteriaceae bacterium]